jgi:hypothetical protein
LQAARGGDADSSYSLGRLLIEQEESTEAESWLREAAQKCHPGAMIELARLLRNTGQASEVSLWAARAAEYYRRQVDDGDVDAMLDLAEIYEKENAGNEVLYWLQRAADLGNDQAREKLAALRNADRSS